MEDEGKQVYRVGGREEKRKEGTGRETKRNKNEEQSVERKGQRRKGRKIMKVGKEDQRMCVAVTKLQSYIICEGLLSSDTTATRFFPLLSGSRPLQRFRQRQH